MGGRHSGSGGYSHRVQRLGVGWYRLSWTFDAYYSGSRLRHPRSLHRDTDLAGAKRFVRKWKVPKHRRPDDGHFEGLF